MVPVRVEGADSFTGPMLLDCDESFEQSTGLVVDDALIQPTKEGYAALCLKPPGMIHALGGRWNHS